jgi:hypothetical protein
MPRIMADHNVEGQFRDLVAFIERGFWRELWIDLNMEVELFATLGLAEDAPDAVVWRACQSREVLLFTANRNGEGDDSLEATIRRENTPTSLPVFTLANVRHFEESREYAERVALRLLEYLLAIDTYRGAGRLYLP